VFPITIPPLRERPDDIAILARHFVERFCRDLKKDPAMLAPSAIEEMKKYHWPGNVRELQNCIERAVILADGDSIQPRHLSLTLVDPSAVPDAPPPDPWAAFDFSGSLNDVARRAIAQVERRKIEQTLRDAEQNRGRAAELLGLTYKGLLGKLKEHRLE
jgi:two-component system, NtrC family, response regulator AtoC